ncbi:hypothetical protein HJFPF1_05411 [Paramyrothecium foliicola]|nr:hypothetical protein HJFPF1_05411 [Paramyrothecium foliicola]
MEAPPISGLPDLLAHLQELVDDSSAAPNSKLLDDVELQLTEANIPPLLPRLLPLLSSILRSTTQDPTPLLSLTIKLLSPLSFPEALTIADPPSLITALASELPGANLLAIAIIHKAAKTPRDVAVLAGLPDVVRELLKRWLLSPDVGVGERAGKVLGDLLHTDARKSTTQNGTAVNGVSVEGSNAHDPLDHNLWQLILEDASVLTLITSLCSPPPTNSLTGPELRAALRQVSLSQGRLLRLIPRLATINLRAITHTPTPDVFPVSEPAASEVGHGLLQWAAFTMVDKSDILMHLSLVDFFEALVSVMRLAADSDNFVKRLIKAAARVDPEVLSSLRGLPDRTIEDEAEPLRDYINDLLS